MVDLLIVTGGSKGIGKYIVQNSSDIAKKTLGIGSSKLINDISNEENNIFSIQSDISMIENDSKELKDFLNKHKPESIGLALCASQLGNHGGVVNADLKNWEMLYKINVLGNISVIKSVLKFLNEDSFIRIVFFGGGGAAYGYPDFSGYALSKVAVVRAVENIGIELNNTFKNASIVALAPGAVSTEMLATVESHGAEIKTRTSIDEPMKFVSDFIQDNIPSIKLNGSFIHVRDEVHKYFDEELEENHFKLRRID